MSETKLPAGLYVISTPIGNPEDLSPRAVRSLAAADLIAAEDTRVARTLLRRLGVKRPLVSYHDQNERARSQELLERLRSGGRVALISDQGTPLLSDPGYRIVSAAVEAGVRVIPVPGPSAALAALVASGLPLAPFRLVGFLPRRRAQRRAALEALREDPATLVLFEAPHRALGCLRDLVDVLGPRRAALARNLTKPDEEILHHKLDALLERLSEEDPVRGELTLVVEGGVAASGSGADQERLASALLARDLPARLVRDVVAEFFGVSRSEVYSRVLALRDRLRGG